MEILLAFLTLTSMEIVLGLDNIIFISILVDRVKGDKKELVRKLGIGFALILRLVLLFSVSWLMGLTDTLFTTFGHSYSGRDLILIGGGLFLLYKAVTEMHHKLEGMEDGEESSKSTLTPMSAMVQILILDVVFSLDSVITAVGMVKEIWIMVAAMVTAVAVMLFSAKAIGDFVDKHPTVKILALSFLMTIGIMLLIEGWGAHIDKKYIYLPMGYAFVIEMLNMRYRSRKKKAKEIE